MRVWRTPLRNLLRRRRWSWSGRAAASRWLGYDDWHCVVDVGGLEAVDGDVVFSGTDLDGEVLVGPPEDFERTVVRGLERGLLEFSSDENEPGVAQAVGDALLDTSVDAGRDRSEVTDAFAELAKVFAH